MSDKKFTVAAEIIARSSSFKAGMRESQSSLRGFVQGAKNDIASLKRTWSSFGGKLASIGLGFGAFELAKGSAQLDKQLSRIGISAGKSAEETNGLREQLESLAIKTGQNTSELAGGFDRLFKLTGSWDAAKNSIEAVNTAVTVTGANTDLLAESLSVAQTSFSADLGKKGGAMDILNKLAGAGAGAGGLENVAGIFNQIAPLAQLSGMNFDSTLQLITATSQITKNPGQIGAYSEQILRLFTNVRAITNKKSMLGKLIYDNEGGRRTPLETLREIKKLFDSLDEKKQEGLISRLTGGADMRSLRTIQMFLKSDALNNLVLPKSSNFTEKLPAALNNAEDQAKRLKNALEEAGERFAKPINKALANLIQFGLNKAIPTLKEKGVTATDFAIGGGATFLTTWALGKYFKGPLGQFLSGKAGLTAGVGEGKVLQEAAGVTPVYVVNFSEMTGIGTFSPAAKPIPNILKNAPGIGGLAAAGSAALPLTAGAIVAAGFYGAYRINQEQIKQRGTSYHPKELSEIEKYPLLYGPQHGEPANPVGPQGPVQPQGPVITIYVDNEKKKPSKTIVANRGKF
jgi:hypothetical protein